MPLFLAIYIGTTNDTNGNPRRGWYVHKLGTDEPVTFIDEGYGNFPWAAFATATGRPAKDGEPWYSVRDRMAGLVHVTGRIDVTPGEYRSACKLPRFARAE